MKLLIVDDETPARKELRFLIESFAQPVQIDEAKNGTEALDFMKNHCIDAAFIDIHLGDMDGMLLAKELLTLQNALKIIFATAFDSYAIKAFELQAVDYLLKPFERPRVAMALERLTTHSNIPANTENTKFQQIAKKIQKFSLWSEDRFILIDIAEIVFIATADRNCRICTVKNQYNSSQPLGYFEQKLHGNRFLRINRSYLVNLEHILEIIPWFNHSYLLKMRQYECEEIIISRNKIKEFRQLFDF